MYIDVAHIHRATSNTCSYHVPHMKCVMHIDRYIISPIWIESCPTYRCFTHKPMLHIYIEPHPLYVQITFHIWNATDRLIYHVPRMNRVMSHIWIESCPTYRCRYKWFRWAGSQITPRVRILKSQLYSHSLQPNTVVSWLLRMFTLQKSAV